MFDSHEQKIDFLENMTKMLNKIVIGLYRIKGILISKLK